jgi:uncharacterized coiled-coil protein SlyX
MSKRLLLSIAAMMVFGFAMQAQTIEELAKTKAAKEAELAPLAAQLAELTGKVDALKADVAGLTDKLTPYPRWDVGALGNIGLNFSGFNDWFLNSNSKTQSALLSFAANGFANLDQKKYFWRNGANLNLGWLKFDDKTIDTDNEDFQVAADAFNLTSLFGYKLSEKLAISALGEYRTAMLDGKFNNPGYLDLGVGATWTPITDLVVVFHPLNYNFVFSDGKGFDYKSSLGCKIVADYKRQLTKGIAWKSNLSGFLSYQGSDLHNWTWINGFTTAVRGIGIGLDLGLRQNKQEALAKNLTDNPLQMYYVLGLSYAISKK